MKCSFLTVVCALGIALSPVFASDNTSSLDNYTAQADVIIKATALKTEPQTQIDPWFSEVNGAGRYATRFKVVSVIKGEVTADEVNFRHYTGLSIGPPIRVYWFELPPCYIFQSGQTYLLWANKTEGGNLRQLSKELRKSPTDGGTTGFLIRVGDNAPVKEEIKGNIKSAVWDELVKMAQSKKLGDSRYGMQQLSWLSGATTFTRRDEFVNKNPDFALEHFANVFIPLLDSTDENLLYVGFNAFGGR